MGLAFLQAAFLAGLAFAAIPVAIHLMHRRRAKPVPFPTLRFLREADVRTARRSRLREKLVLLARIAALTLLALALARPVLRESGALGRGRTSRVIVLDNSLSMEARADGSSALERCRLAALEVVQGMGPADRGAVIPLHAAPGVVPALTENHRALEEAVLAVAPTPFSTPLRPAVEAAWKLLAGDTHPGREVLVFSDFQATAFPAGETFANAPEGVRTFLLSPPPPSRPNLAVTAAAALPGTGRRVAVKVKVRSFGDSEASTVLAVRFEGKALEERSIRVPARAEASFLLGPFELEPGIHAGEASIGDDPLVADDVRAFPVDVPEAVRVVLVHDPGGAAHLDPAFYLAQALRPAIAGGAVTARIVSAAALAAEDLAAADVAILAEPRRIGPDAARALEAFVRRGGGLLAFAGPGQTPAEWRILSEGTAAAGGDAGGAGILPGTLEEVATARGEPFHLSDWAAGHPLLEPLLSATPPLQLGLPRFRSYWKVAPRPGAAVLARFGGGDPALLEWTPGRGRAILLATSARPVWSNLPLRYSFVPLVHSAVRYLAGPGRAAPGIGVGTRLALRYPAGAAPDRVAATLPGAARVEVKPEPAPPAARGAAGPAARGTPAAEVEADFGLAASPGICRIEEYRGPRRGERALAVTIDPRESDIRRVEAARLAEAMPGATAIEFSTSGEAARRAVAGAGSELKNLLLFLVLALIFLEPVLANAVAFRREREARREKEAPAAARPAHPVPGGAAP